MSTIWILGSPDAEMSAIEALLRECGQQVFIALAPDRAGNVARVAPGQAATAAAELLPDGSEGAVLRDPGSLEGVVAIEIAGPWGSPAIDHHDNHPLASAPPDQFLRASSIGQVIERLARMHVLPASWEADHVYQTEGLHYHGEVGTWAVGPTDTGRIWVIPQALVFESAADHCPAAAIADRCPGVEPEEFAPFLAESKRRQYFPWMSPEDFDRELEISRQMLRSAPPCPTLLGWPPGDYCQTVDYDQHPAVVVYARRDGIGPKFTRDMWHVRDLRELEPGTVPAQGSGECYPAEFLVGIVAALFEGVGFVCRIRRRDGRLALRSNGHGQGTLAGTRPAEVFLADPSAFGCGPRCPAGQDASYGSPVRGYFGGLLIG